MQAAGWRPLPPTAPQLVFTRLRTPTFFPYHPLFLSSLLPLLVKPSRTRNLRRVDTGNTHGWQVVVQRRGIEHTKFFADGLHKNSLTAARQYRDELLPRLPEPLVQNTTGIPYISIWHRVLPSGEQAPYLRVNVRRGEEKGSTSISIRRHGVRGALMLACRFLAEYDVVDASKIASLVRRATPAVKKQMDL